MKVLSYTAPQLRKLERAEAISLLRAAAEKGQTDAIEMLQLIEQPQAAPQLLVPQKGPTSASQTAYQSRLNGIGSGA